MRAFVCVRAIRDVSSVEVLMNYHQSLKSEVEARTRSVLQCIEMGKILLAARNPAHEEVGLYTSVRQASEGQIRVWMGF